MADMLSTGVSGLLAFQRSLDTTSHNISNVNTPGYSRQRTDLTARSPEPSGAGYVGNGVQVSSVTRLYDDFISAQTRNSSSLFQQLDTFSTQSSRINNLLGDSSTGLSATLQKFASAFQGVANNPTSIPARQTLLSQAQSIASQLQSYDSSLKSLDTQVNSQIDAETATISTLAKNIADLNGKITVASAQYGQPPNDLLDQRDHLIDQLATHVSVDVVKQNDGSVNVSIGTGQPLVVGQSYSKLTAGADQYDPTRRTVLLQTSTGAADITNNIQGGTLGGVLTFRSQVLDTTRSALGQISVALADSVNTQHRSGIDLNGALGQNFFAVGGVQVQASTQNGSTGTVSATRSNVSALTGADYMLTATSTGWALQRADTGAAVSMTGTGTSTDPFVADGLSFVVGGTPTAGDRFLVRPSINAVSGMQVLVTDPTAVAAALPIKTSAAAANSGAATISSGDVLNPTNPQLQSSVDIQFLTATTYSVNGSGSFAYTSGANIDVNGWRVQVSGTPAAGDKFTVSSNVNGKGDNRNALKLADTLNKPVLNGGKTSVNDAVGQYISTIGVQTNQAQASRDAQQIVYNDSVSTQQSVSGVNLDEEAANLVRYQQAYQAAAQVIKIAQTIFQTLIDATRS